MPSQSLDESRAGRRLTVAIVGRPNVGKSTLFNRICGARVAIVESTPGVTRDRIYAECEWTGQQFLLIDTGGIVLDDPDHIRQSIRQQAAFAVSEADVLLLTLDGKEGLTPADSELADYLRKSGKPVIGVVNKVESPDTEMSASEFAVLGFGEVEPVSAVHGHGVAELLDRVVETWGKLPPEIEPFAGEAGTKIAVVGRPNVGKSSIVNALLGEQRIITSEIPGTTRDAIDTKMQFEGQPITLIDTAGMRRRGKVQGSLEYYCALRAEKAIGRCDVAVVVMDASEGPTDGDQRIGGLVDKAGKACVVAANKWDLIADGQPGAPGWSEPIEAFRDKVFREFRFMSYAQFCACSATENAGLGEVVHKAQQAALQRAFRVPTVELNRIMAAALDRRPHSRRGKNLRIYYATMPVVCPPTVVLFVNEPELVHFSYVRYLENQLRAQHKYEGTPIRWRIRKSGGRSNVA